MNTDSYGQYPPLQQWQPQQWQGQEWQTQSQQQWQSPAPQDPTPQVPDQFQQYFIEQHQQYQSHTRTVVLPAPQNPAPQNPAPQDPAPQDLALQNPVPQNPTPRRPRTPTASRLIDIHAGPERNKVTVHETVLMKFKFFADGIKRMRLVSKKSKIEFEFSTLNYEAVADICLKWMYLEPLILVCPETGNIKSTLINDIWTASELFKLPEIRKDMMDTLSKEIKRDGITSTSHMIATMKFFFAKSNTDDQNMICDVLKTAIGRLTPLQWYAAIRVDDDPHAAFYQRLAGLAFLAFTMCVCGGPDCRLGKMNKRHCAVCKQKINKTVHF
ncbi:hypothetical protein AA313_de0201004 [Arthrobotrys entomopaga]|nr:hypothetical protein AA313_de0201004 [Arthrobotrys entomopaga]